MRWRRPKFNPPDPAYYDSSLRVLQAAELLVCERLDPPLIRGSITTWRLFLADAARAVFAKRPVVVVSMLVPERSLIVDLPGVRHEAVSKDRLLVWTSETCPPVVAAEVVTSQDFYEGECWIVAAEPAVASDELYERLLDSYPEAPALQWPYFRGDTDGEELRWGLGENGDPDSAKRLLEQCAEAAGCRVAGG